MLTRRNAMLAGSALVTRACLATDSCSADNRSVPKTPAQAADGEDIQRSSQLCKQVANAAHECLQATTESHSLEFAELCRDAADICLATASLMTRNRRLGAAICQACADACDRFANGCAEVHLNGLEGNSRVLAIRCANSCRAIVAKSLQ